MIMNSRNKLNHQISQEAAEWVVEFRSHDIDATERRAFDGWIRTSPEHLRAFLEMAMLWSEAREIDSQHAIDIDALIARARGEAGVLELPLRPATLEQRPSSPARRFSQTWQFRALAAGVLTAIVGTALFIWAQQDPNFATRVGERRVVHLSDGSDVTLDSKSHLQVHFTASARTVALTEGQALFRVAKNAKRPFIVQSGDSRELAVGTQFDVNLKADGVIVTVLEGRVAVYGSQSSASSGDAVLVSAGEQLSLRNGTQTGRPAQIDAGVTTAWTEGHIVLASSTLAEAAEAFSRYSQRQLIAEDLGNPPLRISGVFATNPDFLLRYLRDRPDITVHEEADKIELIRSPAR